MEKEKKRKNGVYINIYFLLKGNIINKVCGNVGKSEKEKFWVKKA